MLLYGWSNGALTHDGLWKLSLVRTGWMDVCPYKNGRLKIPQNDDFLYHCKRRGWKTENSRTQNTLFFSSKSTFFPLQSFFDKTEGRNKLLEFKIVDKSHVIHRLLVSKHLTQIGGSIQSAYSSPKYICYGHKAMSKYF